MKILKPGSAVQLLAWGGEEDGANLPVQASVTDVNGISEVIAIDVANDQPMTSLSKISDSDGTARLWLEQSNQDLTIEIWSEILRSARDSHRD